MTVRAQKSQIVESVVFASSVQMIQLQRNRLSVPDAAKTDLALVSLEPGSE